jgi:hypothetical protein
MGPSRIVIDASAVFLGTQRVKVLFPIRYMAIRYGLLRTAIKTGEVRLQQTPTAEMVAVHQATRGRGVQALQGLRARVLGIPEELFGA